MRLVYLIVAALIVEASKQTKWLEAVTNLLKAIADKSDPSKVSAASNAAWDMLYSWQGATTLAAIFVLAYTLARLIFEVARTVFWRRPWRGDDSTFGIPTILLWLTSVLVSITGTILYLIWREVFPWRFLSSTISAMSRIESDPAYLPLEIVSLHTPVAGAAIAATVSVIALFRLRRNARALVTDSEDDAFACLRDPLREKQNTHDKDARRNIVVFCDGTGNAPRMMVDGRPAATNIYRMYETVEKSETQVARYDAGVGTGTSSQAIRMRTLGTVTSGLGYSAASKFVNFVRNAWKGLEAATGLGITENVAQAYETIARYYRPGDAVYIFGFSRGAYTARCVAGVIYRCGLLRAENAHLSRDLVQLYRTREISDSFVLTDPALIHEKLPTIKLLGLFDTVASLGVPMWGWWFNFRRIFMNASLNTNPAPICELICHALAMDERRAQYFPTLFEKPDASNTRLVQEWFRGAHADIGGGYPDRGLSDITLNWMINHAKAAELRFDSDSLAALKLSPTPLAILHDEIDAMRAWSFGGSWPRWHPITDDTAGGASPPSKLSNSVQDRASSLKGRGLDDLRSVEATPICVSVAAARQWSDCGVVLEGGGAIYRLSRTDTQKRIQWRDWDCAPCGPSGQWPGNAFRAIAGFFKRMKSANYMTLCITIAHPRHWPLREHNIFTLIGYFLIADPEPLTEQIAAIGGDLENDDVYIRNDTLGGKLHGFANDLWIAAFNNSGRIEFDIQRVDRHNPNLPLWLLLPQDDAVTGNSPNTHTMWGRLKVWWKQKFSKDGPDPRVSTRLWKRYLPNVDIPPPPSNPHKRADGEEKLTESAS